MTFSSHFCLARHLLVANFRVLFLWLSKFGCQGRLTERLWKFKLISPKLDRPTQTAWERCKLDHSSNALYLLIVLMNFANVIYRIHFFDMSLTFLLVRRFERWCCMWFVHQVSCWCWKCGQVGNGFLSLFYQLVAVSSNRNRCRGR